MERQGRGRTMSLAVCGVMTAALCVLAPLAVPIGPVPVTLATLVICLTASLLGWKWGTASVAAYLLIGLAGAPVFSGWQSGAAPLLGPTGGYLAGYLPLVFLSGWAARAVEPLEARGGGWTALALALRYAGMLAGTAALYALGTAWYCLQGGVALGPALTACVVPFIPFDLAKTAIALAVGAPVRRRLEQAGLL